MKEHPSIQLTKKYKIPREKKLLEAGSVESETALSELLSPSELRFQQRPARATDYHHAAYALPSSDIKSVNHPIDVQDVDGWSRL